MPLRIYPEYTDWRHCETPVRYPDSFRLIKICHPGYVDSLRIDNALFTFPAVDLFSPQPGGNNITAADVVSVQTGSNNTAAADQPACANTVSQFGIQFGVAITARRIVACNRDGYLTEHTRDGPRVVPEWDSVLLADKYYFHVELRPGETPSLKAYFRYPICPSFQQWQYPTEEDVPDKWTVHDVKVNSTASGTQMSSMVQIRDAGACRMSPQSLVMKNAHVIPRAEREWFLENVMQTYNGNPTVDDIMNDVRNGLYLGVHIHRLWDDARFTFVPKNDKFVLHVCEVVDATQICTFYQNVQLRVPSDFSAHFYYARFAWTVFPLLTPFLRFQRITKDMLPRPVSPGTIPSPVIPDKRKDGPEAKEGAEYEDRAEGFRVTGPCTKADSAEMDVGDEAEYQAELELAQKRFGHKMDEKEWSTSYTFQNINWYPGSKRVDREKRRLLDAMAGGQPISKALPSLAGSCGEASGSDPL